MWKKPDADGRYPLSYRELLGIRCLFGANNALLQNYKELESRIRTIPNAWRDLKLIMKLQDKLLESLLKTIPTNKLKALRTELQHTICELRVEKPLMQLHPDCSYVPTAAMERVIDHAVAVTCFGCERCGKDAKRCQLYQDLNELYHHECAQMKGDMCPFSSESELAV